MFEFAIFDDGRGLEYSLCKNSSLKREIDKGSNVIDLAMNPGVSSFSNHKYLISNDFKWKNSGFGLSIVKEFCMRLKGEFIICSNNELRLFNSYTKVTETHKCVIDGVGIQVRFVYDNMNSNSCFLLIEAKFRCKSDLKVLSPLYIDKYLEGKWN